MFKISRLAIPMVLLPILIVSTQSDPTSMVTPTVDNFALIENQLLLSSRYTQIDERDTDVLSRFDNDFQLRYELEQLEFLGYESMLENEEYELFFEKDSFSLILKDKATGYMLSSRPEFQGYSETREDNTANRNLMNAGLWIESIRTNNISSSSIKTESIYTIADVSYANNGAQDLDNIDWTLPYILTPNSYDENAVSVGIADVTADSFSVNLDIKTYGFTFVIDIELHEGGFAVKFDPASLIEANDLYRVLGLQFFPYFGSAREDIFPGYVVIPDGVGAMIRTNQRYDQTYQSDYFGSDLGYLRPSIAELSLPIYGMIHRVNEFGFYHEIYQGAEHATLLANFWGRNTRYHRITNRYNLRRIYRNIINRAGDGLDVLPEEKIEETYHGFYHMLTGSAANYVGLAKAYQLRLKDREALRMLEPEKTPIQLSYLLYEQEPTFFGTSRLTMTSTDDVTTMTNELRDLGLDEQVMVLKGWSNDGLSYRQPYQFQHPNLNGLKRLIQNANTNEDAIYLEQDYLVSSELSNRIEYNRDVARNYSKLKMSYPLSRLDNQPIDEYYVYPLVAANKLNVDIPSIESLDITGLSYPTLGRTLYSYYDDERISRTETLDTVTSMAQRLPANAMHRPSSYMFPYLNHYLDMPVTNSQLDLFTDLIPLIPIVLKGYIPTFTPYLNFNALGKERLLQMIDYGTNPSYLLTENPSSDLRFTYSNRYFTTAYDDFKTDITDVYAYVSGALDFVQGASVIQRDMLTTGVTQIDYDNGVSLIVNYRSEPWTNDGISVAGQDYEVILP